MELRTKLLFTYEEAAAALAMSRAALRDLVYKGRGPVVTKIGRRTFFALSDLEAFVTKHRVLTGPVIEHPVERPRRKRGRPTIAEMMQSQSVVLH